jgi:hypothetical protein
LQGTARSSRFLRRFMLSSDKHPFIGRIYDLSVVEMSFDSYAKLASYTDCKYVFHVNGALSTLVQRVESLNMVGSLLWPNPLPNDSSGLSISLFEWLTVAADVFLMRYISVLDCVVIVTNEVYECGLERRKCSIENLKRKGVATGIIALLTELQTDQGDLRDERNARFHYGAERALTVDDDIFRFASAFKVQGTFADGRRINVQRTFKEELVDLQREFNRVGRALVRQLDRLYDLLGVEFENRFAPKFKVGFGAKHCLSGTGTS